MRRARRLVLLAAVVVAALVVLEATVLSPSAGPLEQLRRSVTGAEPAARFSFVLRSREPAVVGCFVPFRHYRGLVDTRSGWAAFGASDGALVAAESDGRVLLHASLFTAPPGDGWLGVERRDLTDAVPWLRRVVGPSLARELVTPALPLDGRTLALGVLDVAADVEPVRARRVAGVVAEGHAVEVDPERYAGEAGGSGVGEEVPRFRLWRAGGEVVRVEVLVDGGVDGGDAPSGWTTDYRREVRLEAVPAAQDLTVEELRALRPALPSCALEL